MSEITVDESRLPIVLISYPELVTFEQLQTLFARYDLLSRRHPRIAYLIDLRRLNPVRSAIDMRQALVQLFTAHRPTLARVTLCEARVVPGTLLRTGLAAFDSLATDKWPCANFGTMPEAETWVKNHLARAGAIARPT